MPEVTREDHVSPLKHVVFFLISHAGFIYATEHYDELRDEGLEFLKVGAPLKPFIFLFLEAYIN